MYDKFYSPSNKEKQSRNQAIDKWNENVKRIEKLGVFSQSHTINSITIRDTFGFIDRTWTYCLDEKCTNSVIARGYEKWIYLNNHWYPTLEEPDCIRNTGYNKPPEFDRAINLILQRARQVSNEISIKWANELDGIKNCINIQYANSDYEMGSAEGYFSLTKNQDLEEYKITVSPRYSIKDDLITAVLLVHELTHVVDYSNFLLHNTPVPCFEAEANAFNNQNWFLGILNSEEISSINSRYNLGGSAELRQIVDTYITIPRYPGNSFFDRALNFVKANPYYQEQCRN